MYSRMQDPGSDIARPGRTAHPGHSTVPFSLPFRKPVGQSIQTLDIAQEISRSRKQFGRRSFAGQLPVAYPAAADRCLAGWR